MTILASDGLQACCIEDFSRSAASEAAQQALNGRFVLPTFLFRGNGQAISLLHLDFIFMGAASLVLGRQWDKLIRNLLNRDSRGWRCGSWGRAHLWVIGSRCEIRS